MKQVALKQSETVEMVEKNHHAPLGYTVQSKPDIVPAGDAEDFKVKRLNASYFFREKRILINSLVMWFTW